MTHDCREPFLAELWQSGEYSDLTIECDNQAFKVHKAVVAKQSPVIAAAFKANRSMEVCVVGF